MFCTIFLPEFTFAGCDHLLLLLLFCFQSSLELGTFREAIKLTAQTQRTPSERLVAVRLRRRRRRRSSCTLTSSAGRCDATTNHLPCLPADLRPSRSARRAERVGRQCYEIQFNLLAHAGNRRLFQQTLNSGWSLFCQRNGGPTGELIGHNY